MPPVATYRLQLRPGFGFDDAAAVVPYLAELGVSHVYCSPYLQAAPGSTHGYDVVDHRRLNEELGGEEAHQRLCDALAAHGMSHIVDIVPNHMAIGGRLNTWWWDVLENGPSSRWASFFDIDWSAPEERLRQRVLLPVLGDHYGRVLEEGDIRLQREGGSFVVRYFEHEAPISPRTVDELLGAAAEASGSDELASVAVALGRLPPATAVDRQSVDERHRDKEVLRARLERLLAEDPVLAKAVDGQVERVNTDPDALDALLLRQNYRLAFWRVAARELDYRRFFDIPSLVALHMDDPEVFAEAHELILRLVAEGKVTGLRIDHPDGLRDPAGYFRRLRDEVGPDTYVVAEKILEAEEDLPASWAVEGTTGYDFCNQVAGLFVDPAGEGQLTELYVRFTGDEADFEVVAHDARHEVMRNVLAADVTRITSLLVGVCERHRRYRDYTRYELHEAVREVTACFPVYRTYVEPASEPSGADVATIEQAVADAGEHRPDLDPDVLAFLRDVLLLRLPGELEAEVALRFQQLTAPVMAKGVEDTAFYRYLRLLTLNEVGGDPGRFGTAPEDFHRHNAHRASTWPATMLGTSTHDTKRSEDVRVRLALLSEIPEQWALAVRRWSAINERHRQDDWPDRATEYLLYQTVVGAWPLEPERAHAYVEKAVKEAKRQTSWIDPDPDYEKAVHAFVAGIMGDPEFAAMLETFVRPLVAAGRVTSLAQTLLKLTSPGVPDIYQGTELWDLSLVDPDNRRPVDFASRRDLLDKVRDATAADVMAGSDEGAPKLWLLHRALAARKRRPAAFGSGAAYQPLWAEGEKSTHVVAYLRGTEAVVVVPRLVTGLRGPNAVAGLRAPNAVAGVRGPNVVAGLSMDWGDTTLELPPGRWSDELGGGGRSWEGGQAGVAVAELLADFPVALLGRA